MVRLETSLILTLAYLNTILQRIQSSFLLEQSYNIIFYGLILFMFLTVLFSRIFHHGIFIVYIILLKFFESLPLLFDLENLLLIYQSKIEQVDTQYSWNRFYLTLILILIRLIFTFDVIRRKYASSRSRRLIIILLDLLFFILITITLFRDSSWSFTRLGRKILLGTLIARLNYLFSNEDFWHDVMQKNNQHRSHMMIILRAILYLRWIVSVAVLCLFGLHRLQSTIIIGEYQNFLTKEFLFKHIQSNGVIYALHIFLLNLISWDATRNRKALKKYGIERFCTGLDFHSKKPVDSICAICLDEKQHEYFDMQLSTACQHVDRTVCDNCLFEHVRQHIQITFTDDIPCPEQNCSVIFDYHTVRNILQLGGDAQLIERYDRYVVHRQLEQMDEFIWCANPSCHAGQLNEGGRSNMIVICYHCQQKTCFRHKVQWHEGMTCEEYDDRNDPNFESSRKWMMENSKKCPNCPYQIEKNQGCDHMKCIKCRHEFCWSCLADFQPIRQDGNHRHHNTCKYYAR